MPRFVAIRDCLGFHASYEGVVGIVGELTDRELNPLVHHYPGMIYKASFNTADQAVQWLWTEVYNRPADQDLRARQFEFDARLFPMAIASSLSGSAVEQLPPAFRAQVFRALRKMRQYSTYSYFIKVI